MKPVQTTLTTLLAQQSEISIARNRSNTRNTSSPQKSSESTVTHNSSNKLVFGKTHVTDLMMLIQGTTSDEGKNLNGVRLRTSIPDEEL